MNDNLQQKLAALSPEKRAALIKKLKQDKAAAAVKEKAVSKPSHIVPDPSQQHLPFPLTEIQQAYFIGRQSSFELGNVSARGYTEIRCKHLDISQLIDAWNGMIERHAMLRAFVQPNGQQVIQPNVPSFSIAERDFRGLAADVQHRELMKIREDMSHRVIPADQWPLFEMEASHLSDDECILHIGIDVLIFDAWSYDILNWELEQRYRNPDIALPELSLTFRDYVLALNDNASSHEYEQAKAYWMQRIEALPGPPELPLATDPKLITKPRFDRLTTRIPKAQWETFKALAGKAGVTPSVALLTLYTDVLGVWSKSPHFSLNLTLFNRLPLHDEVNDIIGDFTNLVMVEVGRDLTLNFQERAKAIQTQLWQDMDHRAFSGVSVLRELSKKWGRINQPVMPVVFTSAVGHAMPESQGAHFTWLGEEVFTITQTPQVWLDNQIFEDRGDLVFDWDYVQTLFPYDLLESMFEGFCNELHRLIAQPSAWQDQQPDFVPSKMKSVRHNEKSVAGAFKDIGQYTLLHQGFVQQALATPTAVAVIDGEHTISYGALYCAAQQLAQQLQTLGLQQSELVGVSANKDWTQVAGVLGVLMAGGAYLPLDPELPEQRLHYILTKSSCRVVIDAWPERKTSVTAPDKALKAYASDVHILPVNLLDDCGELPPLPAIHTTPTDLAYVIFTSGSTGQPKGVMIDHRGAMNTICDINQRFSVTANDKVLALSALSFDLSVYDIFGVLGAGGTMIMPERARHRDSLHWSELMSTHKVSIWNTAPALMEMFITGLEGAKLPLPASLRFVLMSGDWIPVTLPKRINAIARNRVQINSLGGATEGSIWSIIYPIDTDCSALKSVPYGKGLVNQDVQVLDGRYRQKPDWVPGDLYITGQGVALGYLGDEERTNAAFKIHPHTGERVYRTGDLGRYLPDGNIEFLGREDFQVKVQGFRIELGEIESLLAQHPDVQNVVVDVVGKPQNRRLAAFIVLNDRDGTKPLAGVELLTDGKSRMQFRLDKVSIRAFDDTTPSISLKTNDAQSDALAAAFYRRKTMRCFTGESVPFADFAALLQQLSTAQTLQNTRGKGLAKYRYGSSGSLYPVRTYCYVPKDGVTGLAQGTYYFNPETCALQRISADVTFPEAIHATANRQGFNDSGFSIFFVGKIGAIAPLYGEHSQHFCVLEAGLMTQVLEEAAPDVDLGLCQIGDMHYDAIREHFRLDDDEVFLHSLYGGVPDSAANDSFYDNVTSAHDTIKAGLIRYLSSYLPDYMIPGEYIMLGELPITNNGKVDRKALPSIDDANAETPQQFVAPSSELEQRIATLWSSVLGVDNISIHDNFFDIGGNSVHMTQIYSQLQEELPKPINMIDMFFRYPSIHTLVAFLAPEKSGNATASTVVVDDEQQQKIAERRQARRNRRGR